jgi:hypothetical protein
MRIRYAKFVDSLQAWLEQSLQDADRRQLPGLRPLLEALSRSTSLLREADWNLEATDQTGRTSEHVG